ncbi:MAG: type II toxin-antitoxin system MqsA family antitoxin [Nitrospirae bacterium]|nr:type II toxin-antitoxin system MqsA family antitoxin [Nitrospirota bacterium]
MICPSCGSKLKKTTRDYHYTESGLDNIILKGVTVYECPECGDSLPELRGIERIHKEISYSLVRDENPLTGRGVRFIRKQMGLTEKDFAALLGVDPVSVSRWENSKSKIAATNDRLIRMVFVQALEEECNQVARDTIARIMSVRKSPAGKSSINIPPLKRDAEFCLAIGKV